MEGLRLGARPHWKEQSHRSLDAREVTVGSHQWNLLEIFRTCQKSIFLGSGEGILQRGNLLEALGFETAKRVLGAVIGLWCSWLLPCAAGAWRCRRHLCGGNLALENLNRACEEAHGREVSCVKCLLTKLTVVQLARENV